MPPRSAAALPTQRKSNRIQNLPQQTYSETPQSTTTRPAATIPFADDNDKANEAEDHEDYDEDEEQDDSGLFVTAPKLPDSIVIKRKIGELMQWFDTPWLELNPDYQRDVVWNSTGMSGLINSLLEDYYVPPVIFNCIPLNKESQRIKRICVDGKQRLSSIFAFVNGYIPCHDKRKKKWWWCEAEGDSGKSHQARRFVLPPEVKKQFCMKTLVCYEYTGLEPDQEEDLFARVQKGVQLTPAEKLKATTGPWQTLAKLFENDFKEIVNLPVNTRASGFQNILGAFVQIIEVQNPSNSDGTPQFRLSIPSIQAFIKHNKREEYNEASKSCLCRVFTIFHAILIESPHVFESHRFKVARRFAPMELIGVAVLIAKWCNTRNQRMLTGDIQAFREQIRYNLSDLRKDGATWKTMWQFIDELESFRGAADGSSVPARRKKRFVGPVTRRAPSKPAIQQQRLRSVSSSSNQWDEAPTAPSSRTSVSAQPEVSKEAVQRTRSASFDSVLGTDETFSNLEVSARPKVKIEEINARKRPSVLDLAATAGAAKKRLKTALRKT